MGKESFACNSFLNWLAYVKSMIRLYGGHFDGKLMFGSYVAPLYCSSYFIGVMAGKRWQQEFAMRALAADVKA